jgi:hypothetical protein
MRGGPSQAVSRPVPGSVERTLHRPGGVPVRSSATTLARVSLADLRERRRRRKGARIVRAAQHLCDEPLLDGALLAPTRTMLVVGPTRVWVLDGARTRVLEEWPRARVTLRVEGGRERILQLPDGRRERVRSPSLSLEATLATPPSGPAYLADDDGIERVEPDGRGTRVTWESLRQVTLLRPRSDGWEAVLFTGVSGDLRVPFGTMREAIWDRVRRLPGADAALVDTAISSAGPRDRLVWWQGMDTDPDIIV